MPALGCVRCAHGGSSGVSFPPSISPDLGAVELCEPSTEQLCSSSCAPPAVPPGVGGRSPFQLVMGLRTKSSRCTPPQPSHPPSSSCVAQFGMRDTGCGSGPKRGLRGAVRGGGGGSKGVWGGGGGGGGGGHRCGVQRFPFVLESCVCSATPPAPSAAPRGKPFGGGELRIRSGEFGTQNRSGSVNT